METNKLLAKLRKLMTLKASADALGNVGEANAAASAISRLLLEYNLTEKDIPEQEKLDNPIVNETIPYRTVSENGVWYRSLISVICEYNMCESLIISASNPKTGKLTREKFEIIGRKTNVEVVLYLISFVANQFVQIGRKQYPKFRLHCLRDLGKTPPTQTKYLKDFLLGCVAGLEEKFRLEEKNLANESDITALVINSKQEINDYLKNQKIGKARDRKINVDKEILGIGYQTGRNLDIHKGIHATVTSDDKLIE